MLAIDRSKQMSRIFTSSKKTVFSVLLLLLYEEYNSCIDSKYIYILKFSKINMEQFSRR